MNEENKKLPWNVLVVDDEAIVHTVTDLVLKPFTFEDRPVRLISAYSAAEARQIVEQERDIAVALVDIVMETDHAGLDLVRWIRDERNDRLMRIVIRTGQPGKAPEAAVIARYEINDYKQKTELSDTRLITTVATALRNYRDLVKMERDFRNLQNLVSSARPFWSPGEQTRLDEVIVERFASLLNGPAVSAALVTRGEGASEVRIGRGRFAEGRLTAEDRRLIDRAADGEATIVDGRAFVAYLDGSVGVPRYLILEAPGVLDRTERSVLDAFVSSISLAVANVTLTQTMDRIQHDMLFFLGEVVERRSETTGNHVRRVSHIVRAICHALGYDDDETERIALASSLHDVGKIVIPDEILHKPGTLSNEEFDVIKSHTVVGSELLSRSSDSFFSLAAAVARHHHERWDGSGYPDRLAGDTIPRSARVTAVADVFDALSHPRSYKPAWSFTETVAFIDSNAGSQFDPVVVETFLQLRGDVEMILAEYPD